MKNKDFKYVLKHYDKEVVTNMVLKYSFSYMEAFRRFLNSETYRMLCDKRNAMWDFGAIGIFEMWECEQILGDPRKSRLISED